MVSMGSHIVPALVGDAHKCRQLVDVFRAPDFAVGSWSELVAGVAGQAVSG
jgi:hypothetical protein